MKKSKKLVVSIFSVILLIVLSVTVFATNNTKNITNNTAKEKATNKSDELDEDELIPALEEKLKQKEKTTQQNNVVDEKKEKDASNENTTVKDKVTDDEEKDVSNENTTVKDKITDNEKKDEKNNVSINVPIYDKKIEENIVIVEDKENINYENTHIEGDVFIISSEKVSFDYCRIDGNVFIISKNIELDNLIINGSMYAGGAEKININKVTLDSLYAFGNTVNINESAQIDKELRFVGQELNIDGKIGRNLNAIVKNAVISKTAKINGDCNISGENADISDNAQILGDTNFVVTEITGDEYNSREDSIRDIILEKATEFGIILILAIFILGGFPKFTEINSKLKLRHFFTSFFGGILELIIVFALAIGLLLWGYGVGYGFGIITLFITLLGFGKVLFIVAFAVRMCANSKKSQRIRAFFMTIFVALVVQAINLISLLGYTGSIIVLIFNVIIGISGFGGLITVILSARTKLKQENKNVKNLTSDDVSPVVSESVSTEKTENTINEQPKEVKDIEIKNVAINNLEIKNIDEKKNDELNVENKIEENDEKLNDKEIENKDNSNDNNNNNNNNSNNNNNNSNNDNDNNEN